MLHSITNRPRQLCDPTSELDASNKFEPRVSRRALGPFDPHQGGSSKDAYRCYLAQKGTGDFGRIKSEPRRTRPTFHTTFDFRRNRHLAPQSQPRRPGETLKLSVPLARDGVGGMSVKDQRINWASRVRVGAHRDRAAQNLKFADIEQVRNVRERYLKIAHHYLEVADSLAGR